MYEKAISLGNANAYANLGTLHYGEARYSEAVPYLTNGGEKHNPGSPLLHLNLADTYSQLRRDADAKRRPARPWN